jgi:hypothetical protein
MDLVLVLGRWLVLCSMSPFSSNLKFKTEYGLVLMKE